MNIQNLTPAQQALLFDLAKRNAVRLREEAINAFFAAVARRLRGALHLSLQAQKPATSSR